MLYLFLPFLDLKFMILHIFLIFFEFLVFFLRMNRGGTKYGINNLNYIG